MRDRIKFRPSITDSLEGRVVLSQMGRGPSVLLSGLTPHLQTLGKKHVQPIIALTNKAFDAFASDFTQARAVYVASFIGTTKDTSTSDAFKSYTRNRVNLLAQQIISNVMTSKAGLSKNGTSYVLPGMVARKINGLLPNTGTFQNGTLGLALIDATPSSTGTAQAAALNSLSQDQAIEAARVSVINGVNIIRNGDFGVKNKSR